MTTGENFFAAIGLTPIPPQTLSEDCGCCAGNIDGVGYLCPGCEAAIMAGDRRGHPHELSAAQLAIITEKGDHGGGLEYVDALGSRQPDGTVTLLAILERDTQENPGRTPLPGLRQALQRPRPNDVIVCEGWR